MLIHKNSIYRRLAQLSLPSFKEVYEVFRSEPETYENELREAREAEEWVREHLNMTPEESVDLHFENQYDELLAWFPKDLEGKDCYRSVGISPHRCSTYVAEDLDPVGIYWSEYREYAQPYWNPDPDCEFIYHARIDIDNINLLETLAVRLHNPDEHEVRFKKGSRIFVYDVTVVGSDYTYDEDDWEEDEEPYKLDRDGNVVVPINDWRKC